MTIGAPCRRHGVVIAFPVLNGVPGVTADGVTGKTWLRLALQLCMSVGL